MFWSGRVKKIWRKLAIVPYISRTPSKLSWKTEWRVATCYLRIVLSLIDFRSFHLLKLNGRQLEVCTFLKELLISIFGRETERRHLYFQCNLDLTRCMKYVGVKGCSSHPHAFSKVIMTPVSDLDFYDARAISYTNVISIHRRS